MSMTAFKSMLRPLVHRVRLMITRVAVNRVNDSLKCQGLQVSLLSDEVRSDVEHFQDYGFTSYPYEGAEGLFLSVGGNRAHGVVTSVMDRRYRPKDMGEGDVCLFTAQGERVYIEDAGDLVNLGEKSASDFVALAADVKTELDSIKTDLDNVKSTFDTHTHILAIAAAVGAGGTGTAAAPAIGITDPHTPSSVAATKVKAT